MQFLKKLDGVAAKPTIHAFDGFSVTRHLFGFVEYSYNYFITKGSDDAALWKAFVKNPIFEYSNSKYFEYKIFEIKKTLFKFLESVEFSALDMQRLIAVTIETHDLSDEMRAWLGVAVGMLAELCSKRRRLAGLDDAISIDGNFMRADFLLAFADNIRSISLVNFTGNFICFASGGFEKLKLKNITGDHACSMMKDADDLEVENLIGENALFKLDNKFETIFINGAKVKNILCGDIVGRLYEVIDTVRYPKLVKPKNFAVSRIIINNLKCEDILCDNNCRIGQVLFNALDAKKCMCEFSGRVGQTVLTRSETTSIFDNAYKLFADHLISYGHKYKSEGGKTYRKFDHKTKFILAAEDDYFPGFVYCSPASVRIKWSSNELKSMVYKVIVDEHIVYEVLAYLKGTEKLENSDAYVFSDMMMKFYRITEIYLASLKV